MGRAEDLRDRVLASGEPAIDELILNRQSEELFLDFKQSATKLEMSGLDSSDRNNLAKAISGFGNSEGGIVVWGIDCRNVKNQGDLPRSKPRVPDVRRFISYLEGAVTGCTIPAHSLVSHYPILAADGVSGYIVTYIPRSRYAPHQVVNDKRYYMRAGSNFDGVPHGVLQGMFGRPMPPEVTLRWRMGVHSFDDRDTGARGLVLRFKPDIMCLGPGLATDLFMVVGADIGPAFRVSCDGLDSDAWRFANMTGPQASAVAASAVRLAPEATATPMRIQCRVLPITAAALQLRVVYGCAGSATHVGMISLAGPELQRVGRELLPGNPILNADATALLRPALQ